MSDEKDLEELPASITALIARERAAHPEDSALKDLVRQRVELAIAISGGNDPRGGASDGGGGGSSAQGGTAPATNASHVAGAVALGSKVVAGIAVASFVAGGALGVLVGRTTVATPSGSAPSAAVASTAPPEPSAVAVDASFVPGVDVSTLPVPRTDTTASASAHPATSASGAHASDLTREREVLDLGRSALARGRPDEAIAAAERHERRWPNGALAEEREALWIQALVAAGRKPEAESRAARFRSRFPASMLLPVVDSALSGAP